MSPNVMWKLVRIQLATPKDARHLTVDYTDVSFLSTTVN